MGVCSSKNKESAPPGSGTPGDGPKQEGGNATPVEPIKQDGSEKKVESEKLAPTKPEKLVVPGGGAGTTANGPLPQVGVLVAGEEDLNIPQIDDRDRSLHPNACNLTPQNEPADPKPQPKPPAPAALALATPAVPANKLPGITQKPTPSDSKLVIKTANTTTPSFKPAAPVAVSSGMEVEVAFEVDETGALATAVDVFDSPPAPAPVESIEDQLVDDAIAAALSRGTDRAPELETAKKATEKKKAKEEEKAGGVLVVDEAETEEKAGAVADEVITEALAEIAAESAANPAKAAVEDAGDQDQIADIVVGEAVAAALQEWEKAPEKAQQAADAPQEATAESLVAMLVDEVLEQAILVV